MSFLFDILLYFLHQYLEFLDLLSFKMQFLVNIRDFVAHFQKMSGKSLLEVRSNTEKDNKSILILIQYLSFREPNLPKILRKF